MHSTAEVLSRSRLFHFARSDVCDGAQHVVECCAFIKGATSFKPVWEEAVSNGVVQHTVAFGAMVKERETSD